MCHKVTVNVHYSLNCCFVWVLPFECSGLVVQQMSKICLAQLQLLQLNVEDKLTFNVSYQQI